MSYDVTRRRGRWLAPTSTIRIQKERARLTRRFLPHSDLLDIALKIVSLTPLTMVRQLREKDCSSGLVGAGVLSIGQSRVMRGQREKRCSVQKNSGVQRAKLSTGPSKVRVSSSGSDPWLRTRWPGYLLG